MARKKFEFKQSQDEEIEIAGRVHIVDFSDKKLMQYHSDFGKFFVEAQDLQKKQAAEMDEKEQHELFNKMHSLTKGMIESLLGKGTFEEIYEKSGKSLLNTLDVLYFLAEHVEEKVSEQKESKMNKYTKMKAENAIANANASARE